jgi:hypothetical protein
MVLPAFVRRWMNGKVFASPRARQRATRSARRRAYLRVEALEDRSVPSTVMNLNDSGPGSLRDAIATTPAGGTVDFQPGLSGTITLTSGKLDIHQDLSIVGPGAGLIAVSGNHASPVVSVFGSPSLNTVAIAGLTIANGYQVGGGLGGGISINNATLTVTDCTINGNTATNGGGINIQLGGTVTLINSTVSGNSAFSVEGAGAGGGIVNFNMLTVTNSTISGNYADAYGGGIVVGGKTIIKNSTISRNTAAGNFLGGGGGILGSATVVNTIIAGNTAPGSPDVGGTLTSLGHNLIGDGTGGSGYDPTDLVGTSANPIDPKLGPLQDNGGLTQTMALLPGSPAIDAGDNAFAPSPYDQRGPGFARIVNGIIDIGAFEVQPALTVQCSVTTPVLWPPDSQLVNVGLSVQVSDPNATVTVQVFANDDALASDAADLAPGTLRLRGDRQGDGSGRVYLVVVMATDAAGDVAVGVCTVVVPHDHSADALAAVEQQAADAEAYFLAFQIAPPGYRPLG